MRNSKLRKLCILLVLWGSEVFNWSFNKNLENFVFVTWPCKASIWQSYLEKEYYIAPRQEHQNQTKNLRFAVSFANLLYELRKPQIQRISGHVNNICVQTLSPAYLQFIEYFIRPFCRITCWFWNAIFQ